MRGKSLLLLLVLAGLTSCRLVSSFLHDGSEVARVGSETLYLSDVEAVIPNGIPAEDSTRLADRFVQSWVRDRLFVQVAEKELSKGERDVSRELEAYRRSLLRYRYEQAYVNQRLDTAISGAQFEAYYKAHLDRFTLQETIVRARFMNISQDSPILPVIRRKMSSGKEEDLVEADSLAYGAAMRYTDYDNAWIPASVLSREFGMEPQALLSALKDGLIERTDEMGGVNFAYVYERMKAGETAPLEYCIPQIRDIILSGRKKDLLATLEKQLLQQASDRGEYKIY